MEISEAKVNVHNSRLLTYTSLPPCKIQIKKEVPGEVEDLKALIKPLSFLFRATTVKKSTHGRTDLRKQVLLKEEIRRAKELSESLRNERQDEIIARKERQEEAKKRKVENARKSEVVQVVSVR